MSKLRPECNGNPNGLPCPTNGTAYLMILNAVETRDQLIAGRLNERGEHCAIGSYFHVNPHTALEGAMIDEVAMVNDSMPNVTPRQRKVKMARWLRWKLNQLGMPGYAKAVKP